MVQCSEVLLEKYQLSRLNNVPSVHIRQIAHLQTEITDKEERREEKRKKERKKERKKKGLT
jgi:hypothetical protein